MITKHIEMLRNLPFLEGAGQDALEHLAEEAMERTFQAGQVILEEGSTGREMYLILEGQVEVVRGHGAEEMLLAQRGPGDLFGEMALLEECPRFATIRALGPVRLLEFSERRMHAALAQQPELLYRTVQVLSARLRESDLQMIADLQRKNEELAQAYRELKEAQAALVEKEKLERELELAREIQQSLLPQILPQLPGVGCAARSRPARQVGGDFYDAIPLGEGRIGLVMADVSDKGMAAALFMALTRSLIRAEAKRTSSPREALTQVNRLLLEISQANMFVTVFCGVLDAVHGRLRYVRAGHDYPWLWRAASGECERLGGSGIVLGLVDDIVLEEVWVDLGPGDLLALYTDGITDAKSTAGGFFGAERLSAALSAAGELSAQDACDAIFAQVDGFRDGAIQFDDMALLLVKMEDVS
jgi:sigma-B regulation protein RsbU (phosphoserine phosphatase)